MSKKGKKREVGEDGTPLLEQEEIAEVQDEIRMSFNDHIKELAEKEEFNSKINPF